MKTHEATEQAYKNGYAKGYEDGKKAMVMHGSWIEPAEEGAYHLYECSVCGGEAPQTRYNTDMFSDFCPNCGADMRGEKDG